MMERWDEEDDARRILQRALTIGEMFAVERPLPAPLSLLPEEEFETGLVSSLRVDRYAQVSVRTNHYSVPVRLIGHVESTVTVDVFEQQSRELVPQGFEQARWQTLDHPR